jgi:hypothetical protein
MADSGAIRQRRSKAHKAGDHSLCGSRCSAAPRRSPFLLAVVPPSVPAPEFDAAAEMRALAARMAEAHRADPSNAILGAELRKTLAELMPKNAGKPDADLTGLFSALQA